MNALEPTPPTVVLVVDDNPERFEETKHHLCAYIPSAEVIGAHSCAAARLVLDAKPVHAIVLDQKMPDADSLQFIAEVNLRPRPPTVVMMADIANERVAAEAIRQGATDYLVRNCRALPQIIERALERAALRERVRTSERQFRDLIEASNDAICILDGARFLYVNQRFATLSGWSIADLTDPSFRWIELVAPESRAATVEHANGVLRRRTAPSRHEFRALRRGGGAAFDCELSLSLIRYDGKPATMGILQDITARKDRENELSRRNRELSVLNAISEAVTQVRDLDVILDGVVAELVPHLEVDAAIVRVLEASGDRFTSTHANGIDPDLARDIVDHGSHDDATWLALTTRTVQVVGHVASDARTAKNRSLARLGFDSVLVLPLLTHDRCAGVIELFHRKRDAFSLPQVELSVAVSRQIAFAVENARLYGKARDGVARLQALSDIVRAIGSAFEVEGVFRIVGERLEAFVPYRKISLFILRRTGEAFSVRSIDRAGTDTAVIVHMHEDLAVEQGFALGRSLETRRTIVAEPGTKLSRRGHPSFPDDRWVVAVVPIIADNTAVGVFVVATDASYGFRDRDLDLLGDLAAHMAVSLKNADLFQDLDRAYRELRDTKDRLVRSEKLQGLGEMAAGVAHDFNNVLSAILGRAQMLEIMLKDTECLKSVRIIEKAALDGAGTVRRIQEFAKERSESDFVAVRLNGVVRDAVDMATTCMHDRSLPIDVQVDLGDAGMLWGNPIELREVITNLIYNAIDAMPLGGRLAMRTGTDAANDGLWFEVEDSGIGMNRETQNRIFDPFFTTKGARGTGLGLSVSYGIVQRHKGEFIVTSEPGVGTRIRVVFSAHHASRDLTRESLDEPPPTPRSKSAESARILVIDDDVAVRDVLSEILRMGDHHVEAAATGHEGLEKFRAQHFDIVFTDLGMPGMDGWAVAQNIKMLRPETPVGLITGWGASLGEHPIKERGIDLVVSKPFRYGQVLELVTEAMELKAGKAARPG